MLSEVKRIAAAAAPGPQHSCSSLLCLDVASHLLLEKLTAAPVNAFPENRLRWVRDGKDQLLLVRAPGNSLSKQSKASTAAQAVVKQVAAPVGAAAAAAEAGAGAKGAGEGHAAADDGDMRPRSTKPQVVREGFPVWCGVPAVPLISWSAALELLEDQLWFEPFNAADAKKLIVQGVQVRVS
jgi:hypothetical protein